MKVDDANAVRTLTRGGWPLVYLAFSKDANRWAHSVGQHYIAKIGFSNANPLAIQDRISSLNNGFLQERKQDDLVKYELVSDPLLLAGDWDVLAEYLFETRYDAKEFETGLKDLLEAQGSCTFDPTAADGLPFSSLNSNGISDVIRLDVDWLASTLPDFHAFVEQNGGPTADHVLQVVSDVFRQVTNGLEPHVPRTRVPRGGARKLVATLTASADGDFRLWEDGPRMIVAEMNGGDLEE
ncbi:hypothetical protein [Allosphingosinicella deserti]|uniref:Uncharacterized protein n=1 Tax=Allosphingosinicella deserti TaxID=2116704 RepID=A0A2P7QE89_9SPHN|nr:hypothetical protein [Sphingomonas deserti]PSJ36287.1 hypothetical protein C7I55_26700 [Sphingomonas deserti]